jgi:3-phytase
MEIKMKKMILLVALSIIMISCNQKEQNTEKVENENIHKEYPQIEETMMTIWNLDDNVDSPAFYKNGDENWIIATMKESDGLIIYNAVNGDVKNKLGESGTGELQFKRPNGIWVIDSLLLVVERDNHRVQLLSLPALDFIGFIGTDKLQRPYGLSVHKSDSKYELFVTDQYEGSNEEIPDDNLLDKRVLHFRFSIKNGNLENEFIRYIGETEGKGVLHTVESIYADPANNHLLIAEETEEYTQIKVYDLEKGRYIQSVGEGLFKYQAEGIALYDCGNNDGYWFLTDQDTGNNTYHIFTRKDFKYVTSFRSENTQNTDGIWLTQIPYENHPKGAFIMVNNDGGVGVYEMQYLLDEINLKCE